MRRICNYLCKNQAGLGWVGRRISSGRTHGEISELSPQGGRLGTRRKEAGDNGEAGVFAASSSVPLEF